MYVVFRVGDAIFFTDDIRLFSINEIGLKNGRQAFSYWSTQKIMHFFLCAATMFKHSGRHYFIRLMINFIDFIL